MNNQQKKVPLVINFGWTVSSVVLGGVACVLILFSGLLNKEIDTGEDGPRQEAVPMSEQIPAVLKNRYFWLLLLIGIFSLLMNANAIGSKVGIGVGSALTGWILAAVHYDPMAAEQPAAVVSAIQFDYTWLGAILGVVILVIVLLLNVEKYAPQYRAAEGAAQK